MLRFDLPVIDFSAYIAERACGFTGRDWLFQEIDTWLIDAAGPRFFLLTGEPGAGKTALAARLAQFSSGEIQARHGLISLGRDFISAVHFCSARDRRWINPHIFAESLTRQLSDRYAAYAEAVMQGVAPTVNIHQEARENWGHMIGAHIESLNVTANPEDLFNRIVREPLEVLFRSGLAQNVVILVDALDESLGYTGPVSIADLLAQADDLPSAVRFILTCRPETDLLRSLRRTAPIERTLSPRQKGRGNARSPQIQVLRDVEAYIEHVINADDAIFRAGLPDDLPLPQLVAAIGDKSQGNFLYVRYLLRMLIEQRAPITLDALTSFPAGLDGIYLEFLRRLVGRSMAAWDREYSRILGVLTVAQAPLTEDQISAFAARRPAKVRLALTKLRQVLDTDDSAPASQRTYALYHRSFGDLLLDRDRSEEYWLDGIQMHGLIALYYWNAFSADWQRCDSYGLAYLAVHLFGCRDNERFQVLIGEQWIRARYERSDYSYDSLLIDIELAWRAARELDEAKIKVSKKGPYLTEEVRYSMCFASIASLVSDVPPTFFGSLVSQGVWPPVQGLVYARRIVESKERIKALIFLAPYLPEPLQAEALNDALVTAKQVSDDEQQAEILTSIIPYMQAPLQSEALTCAVKAIRELKDLRRIAGGYGNYYASGEGERFVNTGSRTRALDSLRQALEDLSPSLTASALANQLQAACDTDDEAVFNSIITGLAAHLRVRPLEAIRSTTASTELDSDQADILPALASSLSEKERTEALRKKIADRMRIGDDKERAWASAALFPYMRQEHWAEWMDHALEATLGTIQKLLRTIRADASLALSSGTLRKAPGATQGPPEQQEETLAAFLAAIATKLPESLLHDALTIAGNIGSDDARSRAVGALAPRLPAPLLREALENLRGNHESSETLAVLAPYLPSSLLHDGLAISEGISEAGARVRARTALASRFPRPLLREVLDDLREDPAPSEILIVLAPYLPESLLPDALKLAANIAANIRDEGARSATLAALAPHLPGSLLHDALTIAGNIGSDDARVRALAALAPHLPEPLLHQAVDNLRGHGAPSETLAALAPHLPGSLLDEALVIAGNIRPDEARARAVGALAPHLPEPLLRQAVDSLRGDGAPSETLAVLVPHLPGSLLHEALTITGNIGSAEARARVLGTLIPYLPSSLLGEALAIAGNIRSAEARSRAVGALAPHLPSPLLHDALTIAGNIGSDDARARALAALAPHLPSSLLGEALAIAGNIGSDAARSLAVSSFASRLPEPLLRIALAFLRDCTEPGETWPPLAATLAPRLPESLIHDVLVITRKIRWNGARIKVLGTLAPYLPEPMLGEALEDIERSVFPLLRGIGSTPDGSSVFGALDVIRQLPKCPQADRLLNDFSKAAIAMAKTATAGRGYRGWNTRYQIQLLTGLIPHLAEPHLTEGIYAVTKLVTEEFADPLPLENAIPLARFMRKQFLPDAENIIIEVAPGTRIAGPRQSGAIPTYLPEEMLPDALAVAKRRKNIEWLFAITPRLSGSLLVEALSAAGEIGGAPLKAELMAQFADSFVNLSPAALYTAWCDTLQGMASLSRQEFLCRIQRLRPIIIKMGGPAAIKGVVRAIHDVGHSWP